MQQIMDIRCNLSASNYCLTGWQSAEMPLVADLGDQRGKDTYEEKENFYMYNYMEFVVKIKIFVT